MIGSPKIFYKTYLKDYHYHKASYLKKLLDNQDKFEAEIFGSNLETEEAKDSFRRTLKADLRQNYFHAIETFFELFFSLNPLGENKFEDEFILFNLANSNWNKNYKKIEEIAENSDSLNFLDEEIEFLEYKISAGHYLFYNGIYSKEKFPPELFNDISKSIEAIKYGIRVIAIDFMDRDEYNCYKHGLRIIPILTKFIVAKQENLETIMNYDMNDSMSFFQKTRDPSEIKIVTKMLDTERDFQLTLFCSNLIRHLVLYRKYAMYKPNKSEKKEQVKITLFGKQEIEKCHKINTKINNLVYTIKKNE